jgi:high affinity sulfate transporter 1
MGAHPPVSDPDFTPAASPAWPRPFASLRGYRGEWLGRDVSAGAAVAAVALPSAIAYPAIAGLPPETGLYASIASLVGYAAFGPSRRLMVGPDAATMTVLAGVMAAVLASVPEQTMEARVAAAAWIAVGVGGFCILARILRLGVLASFLSRPILVGFFAGISLSILVGQIGRLTGVSIEGNGLLRPVLDLLGKAGEIHWPSLILGVSMFALLQAAKAVRSPVPGPVVVVVVAVALSWALGLEEYGVRVVGSLPEGLPEIGIPPVGGLPVGELVLGAAAVFLVGFGSGIITARSFATITGEKVDPDAELVGFASANVATGLFGGFPVTSSDSRTAVNLSVGGQTQVAGIVAALVLVAALLFVGDLLAILPVPALGAILASAALGLIDVASLRQIWRTSRVEFVFALIAMAGAINFGVLQGVAVAIAATLAHIVHKGMHPRIALLGRIPGRDGFYKRHRSPEVRPIPGMEICLLQGSLLFFACDTAKARLDAIVEAMPPDTRWCVFDAASIPQLDSTGAAMLAEFRSNLRSRGIRLVFAELHAEARALLERAGVIDASDGTMVYEDLADAVAAYEAWSAADGRPSPAGNTTDDDGGR